MKELILLIKDDFKLNRSFTQRTFIFILRCKQYNYHRTSNRVIKVLISGLFKILNVFVLQFIFNCDIPSKAKIGKRIRVPHPYGIIISSDTTIGDDFTCFHQVTIGSNESKPHPIVIGNKVYIGTGAKIIGVKRIGNNVNVGANAVVLRDVDDYSTAVGIYK